MRNSELDLQFTKHREDMETKKKHYADNTESAIIFLEKHFDTIMLYKKHGTRSALRGHIHDLLRGNYNDILDYKVIDRWLNAKYIFTSTSYFLVALLVSLIVATLTYLYSPVIGKSAAAGIIFVGTCGLSYLLETVGFKGKGVKEGVE